MPFDLLYRPYFPVMITCIVLHHYQFTCLILSFIALESSVFKSWAYLICSAVGCKTTKNPKHTNNTIVLSMVLLTCAENFVTKDGWGLCKHSATSSLWTHSPNPVIWRQVLPNSVNQLTIWLKTHELTGKIPYWISVETLISNSLLYHFCDIFFA